MSYNDDEGLIVNHQFLPILLPLGADSPAMNAATGLALGP